MNVLIVGGAGYIGSHTVRLLNQAGYKVVVLDNLSTGFEAAVTDSELIVGDICDRILVESVLREHKIDAVMHFAALALVGESVVDPAKYYQNNIAATLELLEAMRACDVKRMVFSSSCATYGVPDKIPITEQTEQARVIRMGLPNLSLNGYWMTTQQLTDLDLQPCDTLTQRVHRPKAVLVKIMIPNRI